MYRVIHEAFSQMISVFFQHNQGVTEWEPYKHRINYYRPSQSQDKVGNMLNGSNKVTVPLFKAQMAAA